MQDEQTLEEYKQQRSSTKGSITRIKNLVEKSTSFTPTELECRLGILESYFKQALAYQTQIERLQPTDTGRSDLEELYVTTKTKIISLMGERRRVSTVEPSFMIPPQPPANRLPHLRLPKFSGKYAEYKNFIHSFNNLVHDDPTLTTIEKFNHLLYCLSDQALNTVRAFQVTESNYPKAIKSLKDRYDNNCLIFLENVTSIFELPKVPKASPSHLRHLVDNVSALFNSLTSIGTEKDICNAIIIYIVMSKVDPETQSKWDEQLDFSKLPTWDDCAKMLNKRCQYLEARDSKQIQSEPTQKWQGKQRQQSFKHRPQTSLTIIQRSCVFCNDTDHLISNCSKFAKLSVMDRFSNTKRLGLCINCLGKGHNMVKCPSTYRCKSCKQTHHSLLHRDQKMNEEGTSSGTSSTILNAAFEDHGHSMGNVILATALVLVKDSTGNFQLGRVLLDSGSQVNLVNESFARTLSLRRNKRLVDIVGIGVSKTKTHYQTQTTIRSRFNNFEISLEFLIAPSITGYQPDKTLTIANWNIPKNINLADENFNQPSQIDMLLGAEAFFDLLSVGQIRLGKELPSLQKTLLGWIVSGKVKDHAEYSTKICGISMEENSLQEYVEKFWELEEVVGRKSIWTEEQMQCEAIFKDTIEELGTGRLMVKLPFKDDPKCLGSSYDIAFRRFLSLERRLAKDQQLKAQYSTFLEEYKVLGHMSEVRNPNLEEAHYFLPHQCVIKENSVSTKLRVVFDASCCTSSQISLNGILMVGPTIQDDIFTLLLRFRCHRYALTADIVKMYRQVLIHPSQRQFQYILWREDNQMPIKIFKLNTITYGTASAPFLAIRCLRYLSDKFANSHELGSKALKSDFYVDDMLTGADDLDTLERIRKEVVFILRSAGFELSKWHSNVDAVLDSSEKELRLSESNLTSTLGITWDSLSDNLKFVYNPSKLFSKVTKRTILSLSSSLFDPIGLLSPIVIRAKIILQQLWIEKIDWDASIPQSIATDWGKFLCDLYSLQDVSIPRFALAKNKQEVQIHGFSDASLNAYGCCIYVRTVDASGTITVKLFTAKSRVAPAKKKQLPRLELCGAHLLAKLWARIRSMFGDSVTEVHLWTDSKVVLYWINTHSSKLNTFVGNRVAEIQELTKEAVWRYVPTNENPADIVSRGCTVQELKQSIWFSGPLFLLKPSAEWPPLFCNQSPPEEVSLEMRKTVMLVGTKEPNYLLKYIDRYSSYNKIIRIIAYILKVYKRRIGTVPSAEVSLLSVDELNTALLRIVWILQQEFFADEIRAINNNEQVKGSIKWLNPFLEEINGLQFLRVGGRLQNANIPEEQKHPLLLPKGCSFSKCMVRHLHLSNYHAGAKALVALIRMRFWIINARELARQTVRSCIHCTRYRPKLMEQIMGNLPSERLTPSRPFQNCGVDFCGPIFTYLKIRGKTPYKTYVAVFVCFSSKAVHLEAVSDLSSEAFLASLKRLIGRRGLPQNIFCDNATNFVGARSKLNELRNFLLNKKTQTDISNFCANENVSFNFIPPRAPHFGGLWESAVKVAKGHLYRSLAGAKLSFEELTTALVEIEAVMNSRPITPLSSDPSDLEALTPGHLLIGSALKAIPEPANVVDNISYLQRWRRINAVKTNFWQRWTAEYVSELQARSKWSQSQPNLNIGAMVIVHEDNTPPQKWLLGRVVDVVCGKDERVRVADIKTSRGIIRRPIRKLALLPV